MRTALISLLMILATSATAEIYKYTDDKGNTVFTNQLPDGVVADEVKLPPANTVNIKTPDMPPPLADDRQDEQRQPYRSLSIGGIPDDEALRANNGTFTVTALLDPPLQQGHQVRFLLDGIPQAPASPSTSLQLNNVDRGTHRLEVEVLSGERVLQRAMQTFTVQRVHVSSPARR